MDMMTIAAFVAFIAHGGGLDGGADRCQAAGGDDRAQRRRRGLASSRKSEVGKQQASRPLALTSQPPSPVCGGRRGLCVVFLFVLYPLSRRRLPLKERSDRHPLSEAAPPSPQTGDTLPYWRRRAAE